MVNLGIIDSGASKTDVLIYRDGEGELYRFRFGLNIHNIDINELLVRIDKILELLIGENIDDSVWGLAGLDSREDYVFWERILRDKGIKYTLIHDVEMLLYAGNIDGYGIAVICGTGSNVYGRYGLEAYKCGDWGALYGDDFSSYSIGREIINRSLRIMDGRSRYGAKIFRKILSDGEIEIDTLPWKIYRLGIEDVASLSRIACKYVNSIVIRRIFDKRIRELGKALICIKKRLPQARETYLTGGLFKCRYFLESTIKLIRELGLVYGGYIEYPVIGGLKIKLKELGYSKDDIDLLSTQILGKLKPTIKDL